MSTLVAEGLRDENIKGYLQEIIPYEQPAVQYLVTVATFGHSVDV